MQPDTNNTTANFDASYDLALSALEQTPEDTEIIRALDDCITSAVAGAVQSTGFASQYGVKRTVSSGSTSRDTFVGLFVDFDVVVWTEAHRDQIQSGDVDRVIAEALSLISESLQLNALSARLHNGAVGTPRIIETQRIEIGRNVLLSRCNLSNQTSNSNETRQFLDISFGRLPQVVGYRLAIDRLQQTLTPEQRSRYILEVRLAKHMLKNLGGVLGPEVHGLRSHAIEQWIAQIPSQDPKWRQKTGRWRDVLDLIADVSGQWPSARQTASRFDEFSQQHPVWHPGWHETDVGFGPETSQVNLLDQLGDGDPVLAQTQWVQIVALACIFTRLFRKNMSWTIDSIVDDARQAADVAASTL